ncbi:homoserine dehydrogenase [Peptoclostridium litorale DSM 5388]|uniref:Homoserine dehydrogenase n=1 Tax=Peptoclostridium litorale DSM 5388 TaxID=1121324 RepID=A0A069RCJ9_PEPLI|nr:homoserine dehydrogenase [Peptoclostridium litorale]KDR93970.1 homoserine dehydrogenase Hom [Peptoclostridium litorale DSM 5388]KDR95397.1 homoserine dehydrogenase Hom [Peptoclostridium litorale DSM 5388]SIN89547.1 homoserine dehydrogenase [Peptoclostridium litorale DSM 5388]
MESIKVALLGFGVVGSGVFNILQDNKEKIESHIQKRIEIKKILVRDIEKARGANAPKEMLTKDINDIVNDPEIDMVVELMGGIGKAYEYMKIAIENKKHIVTANKALIATHGDEIYKLAVENGVQIRYEASVGGGIPIINTLTQSLAANNVDEILGVINGTTNFILTQMDEQGMDFDDAVKLAQDSGFAEADPTSDIEGEDVAFKLSILMSVAFGIKVPPHKIPREGITKISSKDIEFANQLGYKVKLVAAAKKKGDDLEFHVQPSFLPIDHPLASIKNEFNAVFIKGNAVGELLLHGKGAGSTPTGSAVLGDMLEIAKIIGTNYKPGAPLVHNGGDLNLIGEGVSPYYVHLHVEDKPGVLGKITSAFGKHNVSLKSVIQRSRGEKTVPLIFITYDTPRKDLDDAIEEIKNTDAVIRVESILRVES